MKRLFFEIEGVPKAQPRHRVGRGKMYDPAKQDKRDFLLQCARHAPSEPISGLVFMYLVFYFPVRKDATQHVRDILREIEYLRPTLPSGIVSKIAEKWATDDDLLANNYPKVNGLWEWFYQLQKNDADNLEKFVMDALEGAFYENDGQVQIMGAIRLYSERPRTAVEIIY